MSKCSSTFRKNSEFGICFSAFFIQTAVAIQTANVFKTAFPDFVYRAKLLFRFYERMVPTLAG